MTESKDYLDVFCHSGHNLPCVKGKPPCAYLSIHLVNSASAGGGKIGPKACQTKSIESEAPVWNQSIVVEPIDQVRQGPALQNGQSLVAGSVVFPTEGQGRAG